MALRPRGSYDGEADGISGGGDGDGDASVEAELGALGIEAEPRSHEALDIRAGQAIPKWACLRKDRIGKYARNYLLRMIVNVIVVSGLLAAVMHMHNTRSPARAYTRMHARAYRRAVCTVPCTVQTQLGASRCRSHH